jgi:hypothetical protein
LIFRIDGGAVVADRDRYVQTPLKQSRRTGDLGRSRIVGDDLPDRLASGGVDGIDVSTTFRSPMRAIDIAPRTPVLAV